MKTIMSLIMIVALLSSKPAKTQTYDFRNTNWGMTSAECKATESSNLSSSEKNSGEKNRLVYDDQLMGVKAKVVYTFTESDHLMRAKYFLSPNYYNSAYYIRDFKMLQDFLSKKYGKAEKNISTTINKESITEEEWPLHLSYANLALETKWVTSTTEITLVLSKSGDQIVIQLDYVSREYNAQDIKEKRETVMKNL